MSDALKKLAQYKQAIDDDITAYTDRVRSSSLEQFGPLVREAEVDIFLDILNRPSKRIRGALVMAGYEMHGGTSQAMIIEAARAIEMLHAYILIVDDIQDRSNLRRGKPTAHKLLEDYHHKHNFKGDAYHAGISLALCAALAGGHAAQMVLANLDADSELKIKVISIVNRTMAITAHGQTLDIMNELVDEPSEADIDKVLEWKTALYTVTNPLQVGMVLAGAECASTTAISLYGSSVGRAFQITDDILGIFGNEKELGKTPGDDIREGKGTILMLHTLKNAPAADRGFLKKCLGSQELTTQEFDKCKKIIQDHGLDSARAKATKYLEEGLAALEKPNDLWSREGADFLKGLAVALQNRIS